MNQQKFTLKLFLILLLHLPILSFSQNRINGTIRDENGNSLEGATLQLKGTSTGAVADEKGQYLLSSDQKFPWMIVVSHVSYAAKEFTVSQEGVQNFSLMVLISLTGVTIVGTRGEQRTDVNRPVPIDILSFRELQNTGQIELVQKLYSMLRWVSILPKKFS